MTHECGCATFGPGPHPAAARHPNVRGCEHAEDESKALRQVAFAARMLVRGYGMQSEEGDRLTGRAYLLLVSALAEVPSIPDVTLGAAQEKGA